MCPLPRVAVKLKVTCVVDRAVTLHPTVDESSEHTQTGVLK